MTVIPSHDPNFPPNLSIHPSSRSNLPTSDQQSELEEDAEQDIDTYGIAGRTWEAAYLLRQYLTPPSADEVDSTSSSPIIYDPPCSLFLSTQSTPSTPTSPRRRTPRTILEIGSGTGFLSLGLAPHLVSSDTLILTDLENVCRLLSKNLSDAQQRWRKSKRVDDESLPNCQVRPLTWGDFDALQRLEGEEGLSPPNLILASDLVYFPFLYPPLLKTLIGLTEPRRRNLKGEQREGEGEGEGEETTPELVFSYKIRSLVREEPFWQTFGRFFEYDAVLVGKVEKEEEEAKAVDDLQEKEDDIRRKKIPRQRTWSRFGAATPAPSSSSPRSHDTDELYIFIARRRPSTYGLIDRLKVPTEEGGPTDDDLMVGRNGLEGDLDGSTRFEELLMNSLEYD